MTEVARKRHVIDVGLAGYLYLQARLKRERSCKELTEAQISRLTGAFEQHSYCGYKRIMDGDFGGCENGRWTSWTAAQMAEMLTEQGIDWKPAEDVECVDVYL